ncbi:MAG TPA: winged helix DNA-binding domain-containing protein [Pseudonocardiaceae bacterium]|jgi:hypothetical protein|nr:winged helix DNA-binding domain-containing protein [Pseudonocardiaceae bacterium]
MRELSVRALNRALLHRQGLLARRKLPVTRMVERLVGLQAQAPTPPYFGLWSRLADFRPAQLSGLLADRSVVRIVLMRGTIHLVSAADCRFLRPLVQPALGRSLGSSVYGPSLVGLDLADLAKEGRALLAERPMSPAELGRAMTNRWPDRDPIALANAVRTHVPLVQVPPRGLWGRSAAARHTTAETWLHGPLDAEPSIDRLVSRYLAAFGPASAADVQAWSGLTRLGEVLDRLRPELRTFRDDRGAELFDLPQARLPDQDTPAPARLIAPYDNVVLAHANRARIIGDELRKKLWPVNGVLPGMLLVNGFVAGTWRLDGGTLRLTPSGPLSTADRAELTEEGATLLTFAAPDETATHDIRFEQSGVERN